MSLYNDFIPPPIIPNESTPVYKRDPEEIVVNYDIKDFFDRAQRLIKYKFNKRTMDNKIVSFFMDKGLTENQARGIYGNLMQESGGKLNAISKDGHNSYGIAQWTGPRKTELFKRYGNSPSLDEQLEFIWWELNNTHKGALNALKQSSTIPQAVEVFMNKFERPHKDYANYNKRVQYAYE